jgi:hypothetical protein
MPLVIAPAAGYVDDGRRGAAVSRSEWLRPRATKPQASAARSPPNSQYGTATTEPTMLTEHAMFKIASAVLLALMLTPARAADVNDYPTEARADYVYVCMKTNGETREALKRCACSIDVIASLLPYERYEAAETVASMDLALGAVGNMFRNSPQAKAMSDDLRRAEAEAEIRCF